MIKLLVFRIIKVKFKNFLVYVLSIGTIKLGNKKCIVFEKVTNLVSVFVNSSLLKRVLSCSNIPLDLSFFSDKSSMEYFSGSQLLLCY